jgi:hypothetical protein
MQKKAKEEAKEMSKNSAGRTRPSAAGLSGLPGLVRAESGQKSGAYRDPSFDWKPGQPMPRTGPGEPKEV